MILPLLFSTALNSAIVQSMNEIQVDVVIVGGGVAGLWTNAVLQKKGYKSLLINDGPLGQGQSIASQGMIHGGQRYTLSGLWNNQAQAISEMPSLWNSCFNGQAIDTNNPNKDSVLNLKNTNILSQNQFLWSEGGLLSKATSFFASKAMQTRTKNLTNLERPKWLQMDKTFSKCNCFEMPEKVVDALSLLENLKQLCLPKSIIQSKWDLLSPVLISLKQKEKTYLIKSKVILFTAGLSNEKAFEFLKIDPKQKTQRRPLKQIMVRTIEHPFFGHAITTDPRPRVTITSHPISGGYVWYLGGLVANFATEHQDSEGLTNAYQELNRLFPSINWANKEFSLHPIDRAEPKVTSGFMPELPEIQMHQTLWIGWPTKMTFAPLFAQFIVDKLNQQNIKPDLANEQPFSSSLQFFENENLPMATLPWLRQDQAWLRPTQFLS